MATCILCGGTANITQEVKAADVRKAWKLQGVDVNFPTPSASKLWKLHCSECGLESWEPTWLGDPDFYLQLSRYPWYYRETKWEYQYALRRLQKNDTVLEIGCGRGEFLKVLSRCGAIATGLDTNPEAVASALREGLHVLNQDINEFAANTTEKYTVVCHFQVLEHVADPMGFLRSCVELLSREGELWIATPNQETFIQSAAYPLLNMPPHHQTRWTAGSFQRAAEMLGLELIQVAYEPLDLVHTQWAGESLANRYLKVGIDQPPIATPTWPERLILKLSGVLGKCLLSPAIVRQRIKGHSIFVVMKKPA